MSRKRIPEPLAVVAGAFVLTSVLTYPLVPRIGSVGRVDSGDGEYSIWNVAWVAHALLTHPSRLFDANIFYPMRGTLAFSEANLAAGVVAAPAYAVTGNPLVAHNVAMTTAFVMAAVCMYALARHLTGHRVGASFAAIAFAFCPFMYARTAHIQLVMTFGLPLSLLMFHRFADARTGRRAVALGFALALQAYACAYYGVFAGLAVGVAAIFIGFSRRLWRDARYAAGLMGATLTATLLVLPLFLQYEGLQQKTGFRRELGEAIRYSADWRAYLASATYAHRWMLPFLKHWNEVLFPGFLVTALGLGALVLVGRDGAKGQSPWAPQREATSLYTLLGAAALWCSLGPAAGLYAFLYRAIPIFSWLRAPARMGIVVTLALSVLAALTIARVRPARRAIRAPLAAALFGCLILELAAMPLPFRNVNPPSDVYRMLAGLPRGVLLELPFFWRDIDFHRHATYMYASAYHWQPLVNGYSDYIPDYFRTIAVPVSSFPTRESFALLGARNVRYVVFHLDDYDVRSREKVIERIEAFRGYLRPLWQEDDTRLYEIARWPE